MKKSVMFKLLSYWPPYLGAGIRVKKITPDVRTVEIEMKLRFWNTNYVGTQFGGSLYSMCDPHFMLILMTALGPDYIVWDKAATIRFKKPGRGRVRARFHIPEERVAEIRSLADLGPKVEPTFQVCVLDDSDEVIAEIDKLLYVKRKDAPAPNHSTEHSGG